MEQQPPTIEQEIMNKIQTGKVKLRSRYIFLAEKLGIGSVVVLSLLLGALAINLLLFYLRATDNLIYLSFGRVGILAFLESFPYLLVIGFILFIFLIGFIIKKTHISYKRPFAYSAALFILIIIVGGAALTYTGVAELLEDEGYSAGGGRFIRPFFHDSFTSRKYGVTGRIFGFEENAVLLQTPDGLRRVMVSPGPTLDMLERGQFVVVVGELHGEVFLAEQIRIIDAQRVPMIRRGVNRKFPGNDAPQVIIP